MKLRNRLSMLMSMINSQNISNILRIKSGKKKLPIQVLPGQNNNTGPVNSGRSRTFKRNRRGQIKVLTTSNISAKKAKTHKKYIKQGIVIRQNRDIQFNHRKNNE